jgi:hypothetical protein
MTTDALARQILPWAEVHYPDLATMTRAVGEAPGREVAYRKYLIRLVELRARDDPASVRGWPLSVLDETGLVVVVRHRPTDTRIRLGGQRTTEEVQWRFDDLRHLTRATIGDLVEMTREMDLVRCPPSP